MSGDSEALKSRVDQLLLVDDSWPTVRGELQQLGPGAVPILIDKVHGGEDQKVVERAILALGALGGPAAEETLVSLLGHENSALRAIAVTALRRTGRKEHLNAVAGLLNDPSEVVLNEVVKTLGRWGGESFVQPLRDLASRQEKEFMRRLIAEAIDEIESRAHGGL